jgi:hypothetical protein
MFYMNRRQQAVAAVIYFFFGIIIFILFLSFIFRLFGATSSNPFFDFWFSLSNFFGSPFSGIYPDFNIGPFIFSAATFIAIVFYALFAYLVALLFVSFAELNPLKIVRNLIRFVFRLFETLFFSRFLFRALAASTASSFVSFIYNLTGWPVEQLSQIIPTLTLGIFVIEFSTFFILGVIIFLEILFENLFAGVFGDDSY